MRGRRSLHPLSRIDTGTYVKLGRRLEPFKSPLSIALNHIQDRDMKFYLGTLLAAIMASSVYAAPMEFPMRECNGSVNQTSVTLTFSQKSRSDSYLLNVAVSGYGGAKPTSYEITSANYVSRDGYLIEARIGSNYTQLFGTLREVELNVDLKSKRGTLGYKEISDGYVRKSWNIAVTCF